MQPTDATDIEALYRQHGPALLLFAVAITDEPSRAQDLIHQVFLKLIESGNAFQPLDIMVYLYACVHHAAVNERHIALPGFDLVWLRVAVGRFAV